MDNIRKATIKEVMEKVLEVEDKYFNKYRDALNTNDMGYSLIYNSKFDACNEIIHILEKML